MWRNINLSAVPTFNCGWDILLAAPAAVIVIVALFTPALRPAGLTEATMFAGRLPPAADSASHGSFADAVQARLEAFDPAREMTCGCGREAPTVDVKSICDLEAVTDGVAAAGMN
jgi:predicted membrane-bound mannosyltransferase